jgi:hypothetical protein
MFDEVFWISHGEDSPECPSTLQFKHRQQSLKKQLIFFCKLLSKAASITFPYSDSVRRFYHVKEWTDHSFHLALLWMLPGEKALMMTK